MSPKCECGYIARDSQCRPYVARPVYLLTETFRNQGAADQQCRNEKLIIQLNQQSAAPCRVQRIETPSFSDRHFWHGGYDKARIVTDVQPCELSFIVQKVDAMPDRAIAEYLGLSASQLDQILRRHGIRKKLKPERMTLEVCIARTRWLVEERLKLPINDQLPRVITNTHFTEHGLYPVVAFATASKAKCPTAKHFSACAFLVGAAYPGRFMPWWL